MQQAFSDVIVYVDESGNHGLVSRDLAYPIFVLACCVFRKQDYVERIVPAIQSLKFRYFGHDAIVLHEREIRKRTGVFKILQDPDIAHRFYNELTNRIEQEPFEIIATIIDKDRFTHQHSAGLNPYHLSVASSLERLFNLMQCEHDVHALTHVMFESRGAREDQELRVEFERVCAGSNRHGVPLPCSIRVVPKSINSTGLQIADLLARPIGLSVLRPDQPNRTTDAIHAKYHRSATGMIDGYGRHILA